MFRKKFKLATHEEKGRKELCIFRILVYIDLFTAPVAQEAPRRDLNLTKSLPQLPIAAVSKSTLNKLPKHFWYLSEELVALSFFDDDVLLEVKRRVVGKLQGKDHEEKLTRRAQYQGSFLKDKQLDDFVTPKTNKFFHKLRVNIRFLKGNQNVWHSSKSFQSSLAIVKRLKVVNDNAERGVALVQAYSRLLTKDENDCNSYCKLFLSIDVFN